MVVGTLADTLANRTDFFRSYLTPGRLERLTMPGQFRDPLSDLRIGPDGKLFYLGSIRSPPHGAAEIHRFRWVS